ncbi:MAG: DNA helicase PcrA [Eubacterium sp.]|nr:DNA helicase PcrA [Eubacterium sp.]
MNDLLSGLNDKQKEAVLHFEGPLLLLAGAGSGKTRVLTHRIAYLIAKRGVSPYQILALTFTNKAAGEMRERVDKLVTNGAESIWVSTFHSTCVRILRRYIDRLGYDRSFTIYDGDDQKALMKEIIRSKNLDPKKFKERTYLSAISHAKDELMTPEIYEKEMGDEYNKKLYVEFYYEYQKRLKANNALDFDDLIMLTVELFKNEKDVLEYYQDRFRFILVDEYQDTNTAQFELLARLAAKYKNLCVVGDDDQSIYKFRGANIYNILNFEKVFPDSTVIRLEQNYRSTKNILAAASEVIKNNTMRKTKTLWTDAGEGDPISYERYESDYGEAEGVTRSIINKIKDKGASYSDFAILYRTNAQSRIFEEKLVFSGIPYRIVGAINFYSRKEIKDILSYLKVVNNDSDDIAVKRIINLPARGVGKTSVDRIAEYALENNISFYRALESADDIPNISRSIKGIRSFLEMIDTYRKHLPEYEGEDALDELSLEGLARLIIDDTGYVRELESEETPEAEAKIENIESLISKIAQYEEDTDEPTLAGLLEDIALVSDIDTVDMDEDRVLLMTLHGAKGLEFPYVYMVGMEEGIFPGGSAVFGDDESELEEERRLCYVGITRAKYELTLTCAGRRMRNGNPEFNPPSRFINEIPRYLIHQTSSSKANFNTSGYTGGFGVNKYASSGYNTPASHGTDMKAAKRYSPNNSKNLFSNNPYISKGMSAPASAAAAGTDYAPGDRVTHVKFGEGIVTDVTDKGSYIELSIEFEDFGTRKLRSTFAGITKL